MTEKLIYSKKDLDHCIEVGIQLSQDRIARLLKSGDHVVQFETESHLFGFKWKQRCRCGFYGIFNDHLVDLIKGEK